MKAFEFQGMQYLKKARPPRELLIGKSWSNFTSYAREERLWLTLLGPLAYSNLAVSWAKGGLLWFIHLVVAACNDHFTLSTLSKTQDNSVYQTTSFLDLIGYAQDQADLLGFTRVGWHAAKIYDLRPRFVI